ncbi:MAG TPA: lamin tail domain-containing protein [Flavobacteriales bacterium]|nr:lamin tail domain-containing protein [Flavobacteriales bacterium]
MQQPRPLLATILAGACSFASAQIVINEVDYDQPGTDNAEFIEILNVGASMYPLQYLQVVLVNGNAGGQAIYATLSSASWPALPAGDFFVICANAATPNCNVTVTPATNLIQNGSPDAIALVMTEPTPTIVDALSYGGTVPGYAEGAGSSQEDSNLANGISIGRFPDGTDTNDNNADFHRMCSTPGAANVIDPQACDLGISVAELAAPPSSLLVMPSPAGQGVLVFDRNLAAETITFQVLTAQGALMAERTIASPRASWHVDLNATRGQLLLVRLISPTRNEATRIVAP